MSDTSFELFCGDCINASINIFSQFGPHFVLLLLPKIPISSNEATLNLYKRAMALQNCRINSKSNPVNPGSANLIKFDPIKQVPNFIIRLMNCVKRDPNLIRFFVANDIVNNGTYKEIIFNDKESLMHSGIDPQLPLKVLIHGYNQNISSQFPQNVKDGYLAGQKTFDKNILIVDYGALGNAYIYYNKLTDVDVTTCYIQAALNAAKVGTRIAEMLQVLIRHGYAELNRIHLIGHSLGSHIGGYAGNYLQKLNKGAKVARFTALDPAGPGFRPNILPVRSMTPNDAEFVDVLHTNQAAFGAAGRIGQVDIYINGAIALQPTCVTATDATTLGGWCSHGVSTVIFAKSISNHRMIAKGLLGKTAIVGEFCRTNTTHGNYEYTSLDEYTSSSTTAAT
ncbi:unnamed protein product [Allacma fusca]|uniref:Lipase domain-containing protein n=1 Tax=Allacma fusca TaxID=39272 RepID=A0A8J2LAC1_9HEXA|nr:unnamed protein product [Allacma fusca]